MDKKIYVDKKYDYFLIFYPWSWNRFDRFFLSHFFHRSVVFFLILSHKHFQRSSCVNKNK